LVQIIFRENFKKKTKFSGKIGKYTSNAAAALSKVPG